MARFHRSNIGTVSTGTLKTSDLIESFTYELRQQRPLHREHRKLLSTIEEFRDSNKASGIDLAFVDQLADALNGYAPHGFYFGANPGDGADFGFWLDESFVEDFDGLKVSDTSEVPANYTGQVLHVNDHGNVTLYHASKGARLREVWAIV